MADSYADKILSGNRVTVKIGREKLGGTVGNVTPSVKNGLIKFTVALDDRSHGKLRSGLKVDVYVSPDPVNCVALGTAMSLSMGDKLEVGFTDATPRIGRR